MTVDPGASAHGDDGEGGQPAPSRVGYSAVQRQRLAELTITGGVEDASFPSVAERDRSFEEAQGRLVGQNLDRLQSLRVSERRVGLRRLEARLVDLLTAAGFVEVTTPLLMGRGSLEKLGLEADHPLWRQIYSVGEARYLRPMLAPGLYHLLSHLQRLWPLPVRVFEVGPCFRKESQGAGHLTEFTMLNLVELGPEGPARDRLEKLAAMVMDTLGLPYSLREKESEVYGATVDVEVDGLEVATGVAGPHPLDRHWDLIDPWAGWGFGLERLAMATEGSRQIHRFGRGLAYLDGARLNVQPSRARRRT